MSCKPIIRQSSLLLGILLIGLPSCQKTEKGPKTIKNHSTKTAQKFASYKKEYEKLSARYSMEDEMLKKYHSIADADEKLTKQKASLNTIVMKKNQNPSKYYPSSRAWGDALMTFCVDSRYMSSTQVPFATYTKYLTSDKKHCSKNVKQLEKMSETSDEIKHLCNAYACLLENLTECSTIIALDESRVRDNQMRHLSISPSRY